MLTSLTEREPSHWLSEANVSVWRDFRGFFAKKQEWLSLTVLGDAPPHQIVILLRLTFVFRYSPAEVKNMGFGLSYI